MNHADYHGNRKNVIRRQFVHIAYVDLHSNLRLGPIWVKVALRLRLARGAEKIWSFRPPVADQPQG